MIKYLFVIDIKLAADQYVIPQNANLYLVLVYMWNV